jgi:predicted MPP superfamily phosphohydrolase
LSNETPQFFIDKLSRKIRALSPDLILFTGDFLCYSKIENSKRLSAFLNTLHAPLGCFAIYGNHDYSRFVSVDQNGEYRIIDKNPPAVIKGLKRLLSSVELPKLKKPRDLGIATHSELDELLANSPFKLLHNQTVQITKDGATLNIAGTGEYMLGKCDPSQTFQDYAPEAPGIILAHNPDCVPLLADFPGDIILCGHTHGGQINLPGFRDKFIMIENSRFSRGLNQINNKWVYTSRGIGGVMPFRWFCPPEIVSITLEKQNEA